MMDRDETGFLKNHWPMLSRAIEKPQLRIISHGGGVQTSALCLMAARGDIGPMPDVAIMADTGNEPRRVYDYLEWLRGQVPFPIWMVRRPGPTLAELAIGVAEGRIPRAGASLPPFYTSEPTGMLPKQCSKEFKTRVVQNEIRKLLGLAPGQRGPAEPVVELWIGISKDEIHRAATNERKWIHNRHPLVEADMNRRDCIRWMEERQYPTPFKSSCVYCPFRDYAAWRDMKENQPMDFAEACAIDEAIRPGWPGMTGELFVHRSMVPLRDADFNNDINPDQLGFLPECDACGS